MKEFINKYQEALILLLIVLVIFLFLFFFEKLKKQKSEDAEKLECGVESLIRTYALNGKSASDLYNDIYHKPAEQGKSALEYCK